MFLGQHRRLVGGDDDSNLVISAKPYVFLPFATQFLTKNSDITGYERFLASLKLYKDPMDKRKTKKFVGKWSVPKVICPVYNFPNTVTHYFSNYCK